MDGNMIIKSFCIYIDSMTTKRTDQRYALFMKMISEIFGAFDSVVQVVRIKDLLQADSYSLHIPATQSTICSKPLRDDQ